MIIMENRILDDSHMVSPLEKGKHKIACADVPSLFAYCHDSNVGTSNPNWMAEVEDEVTMEAPSTEYSENITEMAEFLLFLLDEREKLSAAIHKAKVSLPLGAGLDGEVSLNGKRQEIATLLRHMAGLRNGEVLISNGGVGYRFNNEGNQVSYRCDVKRVTTINFDRNKIRKMCADLSKKSDETSAALDAALVNTPVEYEAPFDVNETFAEAFEAHMSALS